MSVTSNQCLEISDTMYRRLKKHLPTINNPDLRAFVEEGIELAYDLGDSTTLRHAMALHSYPVHIEEFLFNSKFLGRPRHEMYPNVVESLIDINENHGRLINTFTEAVFTGGIGSAKTTVALYTNAYQLYLLSCYKSPHTAFGMDSTSEILFIFQSMNASIAKAVDYARFRSICENSYYFTTVFPYEKDIKSSLKFPFRIEAKPIGSDGGAIGQNVIGGLIDEVNFMQVVESSKKSHGGGAYNQAFVIYDGVSRRIKTRFVNNGGMAGILCLVSSRNYPGEFTDVKIAEAASDPTIYVYDKRVWEVKPAGTFSGEMFNVFKGDDTRKPRIIDDMASIPEEDMSLVVEVPVEYKTKFSSDIIGSLRDIAGVATLARFPYMLNVDKVSESFSRRTSIIPVPSHDFNTTNPLSFNPSLFTDTNRKRWVHIDLAVTGDSAGIACGYVSGFVPVPEFPNQMLPVIEYDFILQVHPPKGDEIKFYKIRELIYKLKSHGLPIKWVTFDSYQSVDSVQLFQREGFTTGFISMDTSPHPYEILKEAFYGDRVRAPFHAPVIKELLSLEKITIKNKIDHPPNGSKDCSDSMAGVAYGLTTRREIWGEFNVPTHCAPQSVAVNQKTEKILRDRSRE